MMREPRDQIFITCAVTGNLTTPEQTRQLSRLRLAAEIVGARGCQVAGGHRVHGHAHTTILCPPV